MRTLCVQDEHCPGNDQSTVKTTFSVLLKETTGKIIDVIGMQLLARYISSFYFYIL